MSNAREKQSWTALLVTMTKQTSPTERRSFKKCQQASATPKKHRLTSTCARCFHKEKARGKAEIKSQNHISNGGEKQYNEHCMKCFNKTEQNWPTEGKSILGNANRHEQHPRSIDWPLDAEGVFTRGKEKQGWNVSLKSLLSNLGFAWKPTWSKLYQIYASKRSQWFQWKLPFPTGKSAKLAFVLLRRWSFSRPCQQNFLQNSRMPAFHFHAPTLQAVASTGSNEHALESPASCCSPHSFRRRGHGETRFAAPTPFRRLDAHSRLVARHTWTFHMVFRICSLETDLVRNSFFFVWSCSSSV